MKLVESTKAKKGEPASAAEVRMKRMVWGEQGTIALSEPEPTAAMINPKVIDTAKMIEGGRKYADKWVKWKDRKKQG